ncbi:guanine nucleotide exchange factor DBS-like isoform X2 [Hypomesus transpacificus]|uniref:guanine nucleotide exchange factor DBS-like isoform X2 n=1 Tax=Hypomesus transpacificus TaxID=137520 RepID=UPI001F075994|nr:guanine nucleotide exchange factor DBS-like isoform X2 [Hypomesus transpacificus]
MEPHSLEGREGEGDDREGRGGGGDGYWHNSMGGDEMLDSGLGFVMEDVELDSGFFVEGADFEVSACGQTGTDWGGERGEEEETMMNEVEEKWLPMRPRRGLPDCLSESKELRMEEEGEKEGETDEDGAEETEEEPVQNGEMELDLEVLVDGQGEGGGGAGMDGEAAGGVEAVLEVRLCPVEEGGGLMKISLEEVERYYHFCRCCHWLHNEIMQQESSPLWAADITPDLRKQFAFLSGGRGQNGSPIIVFPEFPAFGEIQKREFHNVLTYLTSVPSVAATGVGFILVIDRRQDRWAAVKATLLRIAGSFPGNLQLVLVLRPTTLFQRALSDILFKFNKDEFKMKVPVIMISSVTELHSYIDRTQLSQDLGGALEYCHEKWISHRTAIEGFAVMVKRTAQALQTFGTELAETELPNNIQATSKLLQTHTSKRDRMKDDMLVALGQGSMLLESINEPVVRDRDYNMNQDELENLATVQRLLSQLDETERAFDEFWARHQTKLEQCLQLRHFEHSYREVRALLEQVSEKLMAFSEVGISPAHADHIFRELINHEEKACEVLDQALALAHQGDELIQKSHYAEDSIQPKCSELRAVSEDFSGRLKAKKEHLLKAIELHQNLERAAKWCDDGIYLLASQPVDKCQSHEGAESALRELERYLDTAEQNTLADQDSVARDYQSILSQEFRDQVEKLLLKQASMQEMFDKRRVSLKKLAAKQTRPVQPVAPRPEAFTKSPLTSPAHRVQPEKNSIDESDNAVGCKTREGLQRSDSTSRHASLSEEEENLAVLRRHVMNELLETERAYAEELLCVLQGYASEMDNPSMAHLIPGPLQNKKDVLFGNMSEIYLFHKRTFLTELEQYTDCPELVGRCFLERMTDLQIYEQYCQNKPRSESLWRSCSDCAFFQECQKKLEHKLGLDSYLLKPVQRITKYQLLLKEMLKYSKGCEGTEDLQEALTSILGILKAVNDSMHLIAITGYEANLSDLGRLLMQGSFSVWTEHKKGHAKVKDLARFKPMQRHLFLHEKALLFCKRREESGEGYEKAPSYSYKQSLNMSAVGITENAKGDNKKFEIWCNSREEVYIVQAPTAQVKTTWVNEIRKVLTTQLEAYRASQQRAADQVFQFPPVSISPFKTGQRSFKKGDERKGEPSSPDANSSSCSPKSLEKGKDEAVTSPTYDRAASVKKRFTLQGFSNLKGQREPYPSDDKSLTLPMMPYSPPGSLSSPDHKTKRHEIKSDPTPFGFKGWTKASLSLDASEENDGYSSAEDPMNSDPEDESRKKVTAGKYTVVSDYERAGSQELSVKSGDVVQLVKEGEEGQWFVRNLKTSKEGWLPAANLLTVIEESKSCHSLSSEGSGSGNLSASSSCSETYTSYSEIKP